MASDKEMEITEVEAFLLNQINNALKEFESLQDQTTKKISTRNLSNLMHCNSEFDKLEKMINKEKTGPQFDSLYYLYHLNNVLSNGKNQLELQLPLQQIRRLLETVIEACAEIKQQKQKLNRWSSPWVDPEKMHGIQDKIMILERLLTGKDTRFKAIGIVGIAGVGKTALCQLAFNNHKVKEAQFFPRIWVSLSKQASDPDDENEYRKEVVKRMLLSLGLEFNDAQVQDSDLRILLMALRQQLEGKKYLIVLDDLWNSHVKKFCSLLGVDRDEDRRDGPLQLVNGLPKEDGAMVIVNSRYEDIINTVVGEKNVFRLSPLEDKESCWKIFIDAAKKAPAPGSEPEPMNDKIVTTCAGLPLTAKMMGRVYGSLPEDQTQKKEKII